MACRRAKCGGDDYSAVVRVLEVRVVGWRVGRQSSGGWAGAVVQEPEVRKGLGFFRVLWGKWRRWKVDYPASELWAPGEKNYEIYP